MTLAEYERHTRLVQRFAQQALDYMGRMLLLGSNLESDSSRGQSDTASLTGLFEKQVETFEALKRFLSWSESAARATACAAQVDGGNLTVDNADSAKVSRFLVPGSKVQLRMAHIARQAAKQADSYLHAILELKNKSL